MTANFEFTGSAAAAPSASAHGYIRLSGVSAMTIAAPAEPAPKTDEAGLVIDREFTITAAYLDDTATTAQWELKDGDGTVIASGVGDKLADALLGFAVQTDEN